MVVTTVVAVAVAAAVVVVNVVAVVVVLLLLLFLLLLGGRLTRRPHEGCYFCLRIENRAHKTLIFANGTWGLCWGGVGGWGGGVNVLSSAYSTYFYAPEISRMLATLRVATVQRSPVVSLLRYMLLRCRDLWNACHVTCCYSAEISCGILATLHVATLPRALECLPRYRRGHPRSRFMPLPADKQIAQKHSPLVRFICLLQSKMHLYPKDPKSAYYSLIFYWGNCYCADFIGLRLCPGIYWATPWTLSGSMKASTSVNRHVPSSSISEWDARAFVLFSQVHIFSWHPKKWDLTLAKKQKRDTHIYLYIYICMYVFKVVHFGGLLDFAHNMLCFVGAFLSTMAIMWGVTSRLLICLLQVLLVSFNTVLWTPDSVLLSNGG